VKPWFDPEGVTVNSQGCKPLERGHNQSSKPQRGDRHAAIPRLDSPTHRVQHEEAGAVAIN
jgi:hypothetical protein